MVMVLLLLLADCVVRWCFPVVNTQLSAKPIEQHEAAAGVLLQFQGDQDPKAHLLVDKEHYARQIAISLIVNEDHEITDHRVTYKRDPDKSGTAIQQFSEIYGDAIKSGLLP